MSRSPAASAAHRAAKVRQGHQVVCGIGGEACGSREEGRHCQPGRWALDGHSHQRAREAAAGRLPTRTGTQNVGGELEAAAAQEPGAAEWDGRGSLGTLGRPPAAPWPVCAGPGLRGGETTPAAGRASSQPSSCTVSTPSPFPLSPLPRTTSVCSKHSLTEDEVRAAAGVGMSQRGQVVLRPASPPSSQDCRLL